MRSALTGRWFRFGLVPVMAAAVALSACGDDDADEAGSDDTTGSRESEEPSAEAPDGEPIRLAVMAPVGGVLAQPEIFDGADAAVAAVNANGGITDPAGGPARPLEIVRCEVGAGGSESPDAALNCAQDTIEQGVVAVVGKYLIGADGTTAWEAAGVPLVGAIPIEAEDFTNAAVFPLTGGAVGVGGVGVVLQQAGAETIALVTSDIPAGRSLVNFLAPALEDPADLVNETYVPIDPSADFSPQLAQLAGVNPDGVAVLGSTDQNVRVAVGLRQSGYTGLIGFLASNVSNQAIEDMGDAGEGAVVAGDFNAITDDNETIAEFNEDMDEYAPDAGRTQFSLNAWVSVQLVAEVLAELQTIDGPSLMAALEGREVDLGVAPPFTLGVADNPFQLPRIFRATNQPQVVEDGEIVSSGDFFDLNDIVTG